MLTLHFYVEEPSAESALIELIPRILANYDFDYDIFSFTGKSSLLKKLPDRLKAYQHRTWDDWRVIVLIDRDNEDCLDLKQQLEEISQEAKLHTKTNSPNNFKVINRIIIEELEAWFFGDIEAIKTAYPRVDEDLATQAKYRNPDDIKGGTWEQLERVLKHYHPGGLEKVRAAQDISRHMIPQRNRSKSFQVFRDALLGLFIP